MVPLSLAIMTIKKIIEIVICMNGPMKKGCLALSGIFTALAGSFFFLLNYVFIINDKMASFSL
jgi:hypothetical protein